MSNPAKPSNPPPRLQAFQAAYSNYLRQPNTTALPPGIPPRRSQVYETLLYNNVQGFIQKCFPVAQTILNDQHWQQLSRDFFAHWHCETPIFSQIPREFVRYVKQANDPALIPAWLPQLLDYEWMELEVDLIEAEVPTPQILTNQQVLLRANPTLRNLQYQWPVHRMGPTYQPTEPEPTFLLVYRNCELTVQFMEVNEITAALMDIFTTSDALSSEQALDALAILIPSIDKQTLQTFGTPLIADLIHQNVLILK